MADPPEGTKTGAPALATKVEAPVSPWDKYRASIRERVTLDGIGLPGFWIDIKKPGAYTKAEIQLIAEMSPESEGLEGMDSAFAMIILGWNLTHPETGVSLPLPSKDAKVMDVLPIDIFNAVGRKITELMKASDLVPEKNGT